MNIEKLKGKLAFLREAEKLKDVLRSGHTSSGRAESTAEHSWRLCLMAMAFEEELAGLDLLKVLKLCVVHDLGEAIHGDIPAVSQGAHPDKSERERNDLLTLMAPLGNDGSKLRGDLLSLWEEYEAAASPEAKAVKALDKLETILQHNQGANPEDFDYAFNLGYGRKHTGTTPLFSALRELVDDDTRRRIVPLLIRDERPGDAAAIERVTTAAFANAAHASHTEQFIVNALRRAGQLTVSLVAQAAQTGEDEQEIVGHVAVSPVSISSSGATDWYGLGPISVVPGRQGQGIGAALMASALERLRQAGAAGCVVLGDPAYYGRFGFVAQPGLVLPGVPAEYFQAIRFDGAWPTGDVRYHEAFDATR
ncbi:HAD family hydrolase [Variovorax sp. KBW07]|nr:HAD family hydrolase [Variovorax sp. KBW07]